MANDTYTGDLIFPLTGDPIVDIEVTPDSEQKELVEITWIDACLEESSLPLAAGVKPLERTTIGYLLEECDDYIVLTFGFIKNFYKGESACEMKFALPKSMIVSRRELE